jgi:hypothetical protein
MFRNLFESFIYVCKVIVLIFRTITFGIVALAEWLGGFTLVDAWFFKFFLPKVMIVLIGMLVTPMPWWIIIFISFLPVRIIGPVFFVAFIIMFKQ